MKKLLKKVNLGKCILALVLSSSVFVFAGDVLVEQGTLTAENVDATNLNAGNVEVTGTMESEKFQSTDCTATGLKAVAFGYGTATSGSYSTAMGFYTEASGNYSTAMGNRTTAEGNYSTAMGSWTTASGAYSTAMGGGPVPPCTIASGNFSTAIGPIAEAT
jgi:hypothetical protein